MKELQFRPMTMADQNMVKEKLAYDNRDICELTFGGNYAWSRFYSLEICELYGCLLFRHKGSDETLYSFPLGDGDKRLVIQCLLEICSKQGSDLAMYPLAPEDVEQLNEWFPRRFLSVINRDDSDYVYEREKLVRLPGKKYHGKRNHIARFKDKNDWCYEEITDHNQLECRQMMHEWKKRRVADWNVEMEKEYRAMVISLEQRQELGLTGGLIRKAGKVVAVAMGEPLNSDTFVVHFEKAFSDIQGAYPMINQQFAEHAAEGFTYINREEDTGDEGLRKAKLSYYPCKLVHKYTARTSPVVNANLKIERDQIIQLWQTCFEDGNFSDFYFKYHENNHQMLVIHEDDRVVSMASFLETTIRIGEKEYPARYVYAVATHPDARRTGYAGKILDCAKEVWDMPFLLSPATEKLYRYYEKFGFVRAFECQDHKPCMSSMLCASNQWNFVTREISPEEYVKLRDRHFAEKELYVKWDQQAVEFAMCMNRQLGGKTLAVTTDAEHLSNKLELLMYYPEGKKLIIQETTLSDELLARVMPELLAETGTRDFIYRQEGGMIYLPPRLRDLELPKDGYLNFTLA